VFAVAKARQKGFTYKAASMVKDELMFYKGSETVIGAGELEYSSYLFGIAKGMIHDLADTPFGIATNFDGFHDKKKPGDVALYYVRSGKRDIGFVPRNTIAKNAALIDAKYTRIGQALA